jgi:membrane protein HdeD
MTAVALERRRSGWDIFFGIALILLGFGVLGNAVLATAVSVFFLGWMAAISGLVLFIASFFRIKSGGFWSALLGGALLGVLGIVILRNPGLTAVSLTLLAGSLFLVGGLVRIFGSAQYANGRWILVLSGLISVGLGLIVLFNLAEASLLLLGILLGVQTIVEGFTLAIVGRVRVV